MIAREFYDRIHADEDLDYLGVVTVQDGVTGLRGDDVVAVRYSGEWRGLVWLLPAAAILANAWEQLRQVLTLEREARILYWYARVVGYYSRVSNWNKAKIGELRDRHRGDYGLPGDEIPLWQEDLPVEVVENLMRAAGGRQLVCGIGEGPRGE